jgi:hypothetical protein
LDFQDSISSRAGIYERDLEGKRSAQLVYAVEADFCVDLDFRGRGGQEKPETEQERKENPPNRFEALERPAQAIARLRCTTRHCRSA